MRRYVILLLCAAFLLRIIGISYGIPQRFIGDEFTQVAVALKMLDERALVPNFPTIFYHQPLSAYISTLGVGSVLAVEFLTGRFSSMSEMRDYYAVNAPELLVAPRFLSALLGTLALLFVYLASRELFGESIGRIALLYGAFDFLLVYVGHSGRVWGYLAFFVSLALYVGVKLWKQETVRRYAASAGASLLAAATLLPGIITFVPSLVSRFGWRNRKLWLTAGALALGLSIIILMSPRGLGALLYRFQSLSGTAVLEAVTGDRTEYEVPATTALHRIFDPFLTLTYYNPIIFAFAVAGFVLLCRRERRVFWFLGSFVLAYYLFIGPFFTFGWVARALVPLELGLVIVAAYGTGEVVRHWGRWLRVTVPLVVILPSLALGVWFDAGLLRGDTRTDAVAWVYEQLPPGSRIVAYSHTNEVINQNREVLEVISEVVPERLDTRMRTLLASPAQTYPAPAYFAWDVRSIPPKDLPKGFFKTHEFTYYLKTDWGTDPEEALVDLEAEIASRRLVARFSPLRSEGSFNRFNLGSAHNMVNPIASALKMNRLGPIVEVYEVAFK